MVLTCGKISNTSLSSLSHPPSLLQTNHSHLPSLPLSFKPTTPTYPPSLSPSNQPLPPTLPPSLLQTNHSHLPTLPLPFIYPLIHPSMRRLTHLPTCPLIYPPTIQTPTNEGSVLVIYFIWFFIHFFPHCQVNTLSCFFGL